MTSRCQDPGCHMSLTVIRIKYISGSLMRQRAPYTVKTCFAPSLPTPHTRTNMYTYIHLYTHTYIYTCMHTYIHTCQTRTCPETTQMGSLESHIEPIEVCLKHWSRVRNVLGVWVTPLAGKRILCGSMLGSNHTAVGVPPL